MKKTITGLLVSAILVTGCHKSQINPAVTSGQPTIIGAWNIDNVTSYFYDTTGLRDSVHDYPAVTNDIYYRYQFNADQTWNESFASSPQGSFQLSSGGTYTITSDSTFTLFNPGAITNQVSEPCTILSLTSSSLIFSKEQSTVFNGNDPGYIKNVFRLTK